MAPARVGVAYAARNVDNVQRSHFAITFTRNSAMSSKLLQLCVLAALVSTFTETTRAEEAWTDLLKQVNPRGATAGQWQTQAGTLRTNAANGSRLALPIRPTGEYDFRVSFTRHTGVHSIALIFVAGSGQATFEIDAWGQHLAGIQSIGGETLRTNSTRVENQTLRNGQKYTAEVRVRKDRVEAYFNGTRLATYRGNGANLSMLDTWKIADTKSLGLGAWASSTTFHSIEIRPVSGKLVTAPRTPTSTTSRPKRPSTTPARPTNTGSGKGRVLIVIANDGFFYREYAHPREELEKAGFVVEVGAGLSAPCVPHANSGQGGAKGIVQPDLTIDKADARRYVAILFSGGWGSSMYQYAFRGSYDNRAYNGTRQIKETANRLIGTFVEQDKYVAGLCHGVSVLAWSRINGRSLLSGKRATGPTRQGPSGVYNGQRAQPPSRWNAETNGAKMVAPNSVGNPRTAADDVVIDGKIMTGQDDISARELGRQLAIQLSK
jgi:putative intracellular protease/amidase